MPASVDLRCVADSLSVYHKQLEALGEALSALRGLSDVMLAAVERDRALLAPLLSAAEAEEPAQHLIEVPDPDQGAVRAVTGEGHLIELGAGAESGETAGAVVMIDIGQDAGALAPVAIAADGSGMMVDAELDAPALIDAASYLQADATLVEATIESTSVDLADVPVADTASAVAAKAEHVSTSAADSVTADADTTLLTPPGHCESALATGASGLAPGPGQVTATQGVPPAVAIDAPDRNVVDLATERRARSARNPARTRALAVMASLALVTTATLGMHELLRSDFGQRLLELGTCDGDILSASRDCTLLAWLMI